MTVFRTSSQSDARRHFDLIHVKGVNRNVNRTSRLYCGSRSGAVRTTRFRGPQRLLFISLFPTRATANNDVTWWGVKNGDM